MQSNLEAAQKPFAFQAYPHTSHWFFEQDRSEFCPEAARLAWKQTIDFLEDCPQGK